MVANSGCIKKKMEVGIMGLFSRKKENVEAPATDKEVASQGMKGLPIVVNPQPRSEASFRRHVGRSERLLLALEKAEATGQTDRALRLRIELEQRKLAIKQWELTKGR